MSTYSVSRHDFFPRFGAHARPRAGSGIWVIRRPASSSMHDLRLLGEHESESKLELQCYISKKLHELRHLPSGWDDAGGAALPQSVSHQAYRTMDNITDYRTIFPFITPGEENSVLFEWRAGVEHLEVEFFPGEAPYARYVGPRGQLELEGDLGSPGASYGEIRRVLASLSARIWLANPGWKQLFS